jgi:hypothetical protein
VIGTQNSTDILAVYSGQALTNNSPSSLPFKQEAFASFDNSGVSVALVPDNSGNGLDDLYVTDGAGSHTARYLSSEFTQKGWPVADAQYFAAIPGINAPVYVG